MLRIIGNLLWLLLSGIELAIAYVVAGVLSIVLIVTFPLAAPAFRLAGYTLWPFGRVVVRQPDAGTGSVAGNVVWFLLFGWWLAALHAIAAVLLAVTIIGLPFALANVKLAGLAVAPYGKDVVDAALADHYDVVATGPAPLGSH